MFCGLPTGVMTLPMLEAMATARRKGTGLSRRWRASEMTIGVITRQTTSLMKKAENRPLATTTVHSNARRPVTARRRKRSSRPRMPEFTRNETMSIMLKSSTSVS